LLSAFQCTSSLLRMPCAWRLLIGKLVLPLFWEHWGIAPFLRMSCNSDGEGRSGANRGPHRLIASHPHGHAQQWQCCQSRHH
jgi:hypothetical protein